MKRILVCDDERPILDGLRYLLRAADREIDVAGSGLAVRGVSPQLGLACLRRRGGPAAFGRALNV